MMMEIVGEDCCVDRVDSSSGGCGGGGGGRYSSSGSFTSYATLPNVDYSDCQVSVCDREDDEGVEDDNNRRGPRNRVRGTVSLENNASSRATLEYGMPYSSRTSRDGENCDCDRVSSSSSMDDDGDSRRSSCSDYSMDECDLSILDERSMKRSASPKNDAEVMFLQVVQILRFEKKVTPGRTVGNFSKA